MKKNFYVLFAIFIANIFSAQSELVRWVKSDLSPTTSQSNFTAQNISASGGVSIVSTTWDVSFFMMSGLSSSSSIDTSKYVQFTVAPNANYKINLENLNLIYRNQGGSSNFQIRYSTNSDFSSPQTLLSTTVTDTNWHTLAQSFSTLVIDAGKTIYIRLYIYNTYNNFHLSYTSNGGTGTGPNITGTVSVDTPKVPTANNDSFNVYKNTSTNLDILANDVSTSGFNGITITQQPTHGTLTVNGTTNVTYISTSGYAGSDSFKYKTGNTTGLSNEATADINVITAVPVANNDSYTTYKNTDTDLNVLSNDTSALAITGLNITQQPTHGTLVVNGTTNITYKPASGYSGTDSFTYTISNTTGTSNEATASMTIIETPPATIARWNNGDITPTVYNNNITAGNIAYSNVTMGTANWSGALYSFSGWPSQTTVNTSYYVQFSISPKNGYKLNLSEFNFQCFMTGSGTMKIDYSLNSDFSNPVNLISGLTPGTSENAATTISLTNFNSPVATDGQVVYVRIYVYNTYQSLYIKYANGSTTVGPAFIGTVSSSSTAPTATDDTATTTIDNDIDISVLENDDYSNVVNSVTLSQPSHGSVTLNSNKTVNYLPASGYIGSDAFTYTITNTFGTSNIATVSVNVNPATTSSLIRWDSANETYYPTSL